MKTYQSIVILFLANMALFQEPLKENATKINKGPSQANLDEDYEKVNQQDKRLAACITLFYSQKKKDASEWEKFKAFDEKITKNRFRKIQASMIEKCNKTLPDSAVTSILDKEDIGRVDTDMEKYIQFDYSRIKSNSYNWTLTASESRIIGEADRVQGDYLMINDIDENLEDEDEPQKKDKKQDEKADEEEDDDEENNEEEDDEEEEEPEKEKNDEDITSLDFIMQQNQKKKFRQREELGEEKYRMGICYLFATTESNEEDIQEMLSKKYAVTEERQPKILIMMISKCINTWPPNLNEVEEIKETIRYRQYVNISYNQLKNPNFDWRFTTEETELLLEATKVVRDIIAKKEGDIKEFFIIKSFKYFITWVSENSGYFATYVATFAMLVFLILMCWPARKKKIPINSNKEDQQEDADKKKKRKPKKA